MTKFHLFSQDLVRLETAPTGGVRKSCIIWTYSELNMFRLSTTRLAYQVRGKIPS